MTILPREIIMLLDRSSRLSLSASISLTALLLARAASASPDQRVEVAKPAAYMRQLSLRVRKNWIPGQFSTSNHVVAVWKIRGNGTIYDLRITKHGASSEEDQTVIKAVSLSAPFEPLPAGSSDLAIEVDFHRGERPKPLALTVEQAIMKFGPSAKVRLLPSFALAKIAYPPKQMTLVCVKDQGLLLVFARGSDGKTKLIKSYETTSSSGEAGPKLKEGDRQIPEGFYKVTGLNAITHLAFSVDYPNAADRAHARLDHRSNLGGYIQVHGGTYSTGCIVISNDDMAELFVVANDIGCKHVNLIVVPCNLLLKRPDVDFSKQPKWLPDLYKQLTQALRGLPALSG